MNYLSVCSGIEAATVAWEPLGWTPVAFAEIEKFPSAVLAYHYPDVPNLGDMTRIKGTDYYGKIDVLVGGTPCFPAGHMVFTEQGYVPIEELQVGDMVVTHLGRLRRVIDTGNKFAKVGHISGVGLPFGMYCTPDHPWLSVNFKNQSTKRNNKYIKIEHCGDTEWTKASGMPGKQWCSLTKYEHTPEDIRSTKFSPAQAMYLAGMYLGDGYIRKWKGKNKKAVILCLSENKYRKFVGVVGESSHCASRERTAIRVSIYDTIFAEWLLGNFGHGAENKRVPAWVMGSDLRKTLLQGYIDTDGHTSVNGFKSTTISPSLAFGIADLSNACGYVSSVSLVETPTTVIEGRKVNQSNYFMVASYHAEVSRKSRIRNDYLLRSISSFVENGVQRVYNIAVEEDESYVVQGAVVHNCQSFSVAGLRGGLDDERGNLALEFVRIADESDPSFVIWENVPGVLSDRGNAFGYFCGALAGEDAPLEPPGGRWTDAGYVLGPKRRLAWRVLDAQYLGLAQRRRRVFLIGCPRDGADPRKVLFEFNGLRRDTPPRRKAKEDVAGSVKASLGGWGWPQDPEAACGGFLQVTQALTGRLGGGGPDDNKAQGGFYVAVAYGGGNTGGEIPVATALRGEGFDASEDGTGRQNLVIVQEIAATLRSGAANDSPGNGARSGGFAGEIDVATTLKNGNQRLDMESKTFIAHPLRAQSQNAHDESLETYVAAVSPTVCAGPPFERTGNDRVEADALVVAFHGSQDPDVSGDVTHPLGTNQGREACVAFMAGQGAKARSIAAASGVLSPTLRSSASGTNTVPSLLQKSAVRRLTVTECERLQGYPDDYTAISYKRPFADLPKPILERSYRRYLRRMAKRGEEPQRLGDLIKCADGPRYKAIGNSMAVPVMRWIGERIEKLEKQ